MLDQIAQIIKKASSAEKEKEEEEFVLGPSESGITGTISDEPEYAKPFKKKSS